MMDATIFHAKQTDNATRQVHQFVGDINLGFTINEDRHNGINVDLLLKCVMDFGKHTDADF
jgi:hypothetical protein